MKTIIALAALLCGCVQLPTADEIDDATGNVDFPVRHAGVQTCPVHFIQQKAWIPQADSGACPDGFPAEQVGYVVAPVAGSCERGMMVLENYKPLWGCLKRKVNQINWDNFGGEE